VVSNLSYNSLSDLDANDLDEVGEKKKKDTTKTKENKADIDKETNNEKESKSQFPDLGNMSINSPTLSTKGQGKSKKKVATSITAEELRDAELVTYHDIEPLSEEHLLALSANTELLSTTITNSLWRFNDKMNLLKSNKELFKSFRISALEAKHYIESHPGIKRYILDLYADSVLSMCQRLSDDHSNLCDLGMKCKFANS
jgi:hypothetical protein